jgi:hypothetical protein
VKARVVTLLGGGCPSDSKRVGLVHQNEKANDEQDNH